MEDFNRVSFEEEGQSLRDYLNLILQYIVPISIITIVGLTVAIVYALTARDIYEATTTLKIEKPGGSILESPIMPEFSDFGSDRFISNEIEILKSYTIREKVINKLYEQYYQINVPDSFFLILNRDFFETDTGNVLLDKYTLAKILEGKVDIEQKRGLDIVNITVESPSAFEAALIANDYANAYKEVNLLYNRQQLITVRKFLEKQRELMLQQLIRSENALKVYQEKNGIIELSAQSQALIQQITDMQTKVNEERLNYLIAEKSVETLKAELAEQDPKLKGYLENYAITSYIENLQQQIAHLEVQKDIAISQNYNDPNLASKIAEFDKKIAELKAKLDNKIKVYKESIFASSPEEVKALTQKLIEEQINYQAHKASFQELNKILQKYEKQFNTLPTKAIDLARLERERMANEKLYLLIEEKYQEAQINEQATPGNVIIIDQARRPVEPAKPNRKLIVLVGLILGAGFGLAYAFTRNYFDNTVKTPEDIQKHKINVLAWIPEIEGLDTENKEFEFIVAKRPDSIPSEAYRALRTRILFSRLKDRKIQTILVTSSAPREGKTVVTVNLAGTFAISGKKTVIIDLDLRKPRTHHLFGYQKTPGVTDYLFGDKDYKDIIRTTEVNNLYIITAGTIPPNPAEILASHQMADFLDKLSEEFDFVVIDSPPIVAVTDAEILSRVVDATILVVSANITEIDLMTKASELLMQDNDSFIGVVLNRFSYRSGYGSYYKYYYYYSRPDMTGKNKKKLKA